MALGSISLADRVALALENYAGQSIPTLYTPSPLAYALGWITANEIIRNRYRDSAIDVVPIEHPENGWDRFLITRRTACNLRRKESANSLGSILLHGDDAPMVVGRDDTVLLSLGNLMSQNPHEGIRRVLGLIPQLDMKPGDHSRCWHERAADTYPILYDVITHLLIEHPGVVAARELYVDDDQIDGKFHPLYIHTAGKTLGHTYDWFGVENDGYLAYMRLHGRHAIYRTERQGWATSKERLVDQDWAGAKALMAAWLRLDQ